MMGMMAAAAMVAVMAAGTAAQGTSLTCASQLIPCQKYLNSSKPPEDCCGPLKDAVKNDLPCLCAIFKSPDILKSFKIDLNQALNLSVNCGITASSTNLCNAAGMLPSSDLEKF
ncbi:hypothetical protein KSP40_PGU004770 [Platanthera guangdongensis]|uniref:Bifunctional inhibitor/plant lipid transfer protein/seed storage helical domain-containing protein n=1 Tax=Platanthera guangdongensis TaxID=2320717 RepID=A0ABR2LP50_9ASPA